MLTILFVSPYMKIKEVREKIDSELVAAGSDLKSKLRSLKFDLASGKVKNVRQIHAIKKSIARIFTELTARGKSK